MKESINYFAFFLLPRQKTAHPLTRTTARYSIGVDVSAVFSTSFTCFCVFVPVGAAVAFVVVVAASTTFTLAEVLPSLKLKLNVCVPAVRLSIYAAGIVTVTLLVAALSAHITTGTILVSA